MGTSGELPLQVPAAVQPGLAQPMRSGHICVSWARTLDDLRQAQRLRHDVFARELHAQLQTTLIGHDTDHFDDYCEHLLVRQVDSGEVVGTYRLLTPAQVLRAGGSYCDDEFDLAPLSHLRPKMVELGRSCVHPSYRTGGVILALWGALAHFMVANNLDTMIGSASIPLGRAAAGLGAAAGVWNRLRQSSLVAPQLRVTPRRPLRLPSEDILCTLDAEPPPLIKGYLRLGASVLGPPAWDRAFHTADLPMLMRVADLPPRLLKAGRSG